MTQPAGDGFFPPRFRAEIWATRRVPTEASRLSDRERLLGSPCVDPAANRAQYFPPAAPTRAFPSPRMFTSKSPGDISARFLEPSFDLFASSREILYVCHHPSQTKPRRGDRSIDAVTGARPEPTPNPHPPSPTPTYTR